VAIFQITLYHNHLSSSGWYRLKATFQRINPYKIVDIHEQLVIHANREKNLKNSYLELPREKLSNVFLALKKTFILLFSAYLLVIYFVI
jgi:hypothetical protein